MALVFITLFMAPIRFHIDLIHSVRVLLHIPRRKDDLILIK